MRKVELIKQIRQSTDLKNKTQAEQVVNTIIESIREALIDGNTAILTGVGSFKVVERAARTGRNINSGTKMTIPPCKAIKYDMAKRIREYCCR